jgi:hypothetical protein
MVAQLMQFQEDALGVAAVSFRSAACEARERASDSRAR